MADGPAPVIERADNFAGFDASRVPSPCFVLDLAKLEDNLQILSAIAEGSGAKVLLALKAFSCFAVADLIGAHLHGTAASGLWEARLGRTRFGGEVHTFAPGLKAGDLDELVSLSDHLIFNSLGQWERFGGRPGCTAGLRINPRHSEVATPLYDPCAPWSRLGVTAEQLGDRLPDGISGLHVHALCDQGFEPFDRLLAATEEKFSGHFDQISWLNLGGGQLLTAPDYPVGRLVERLKDLRARTGLDVYLEPGTAVALNAGVLVTEVLDTGAAEGHFAITDASATCHMPDVIEAPYTPEISGAEIVEDAGASESTDPCVIRLGGPTCLAGDVIGTYRFAHPLEVGERLMIADQAYYTMVKASTFNGTPLPGIALWDPRSDGLEMVRQFDYETFENRLS
ncbi:MAG: carboxynorspermidine decarboxylase [Alphaproteobacteria bacterium]|nr:carboxynorspermidine decarboxylase [Alphaproteobacteria bacterium]